MKIFVTENTFCCSDGYCSFSFNILLFFFLSPCLWSLSSPHSPFFSFDQIRTAKPSTLSALSFSHLIIFLYLPLIATTTDLSPPFNISTIIDRRSPITPISRWNLFDHWSLSFVSRCLISGFRVEWGLFGFPLDWMGFWVFGLIWLDWMGFRVFGFPWWWWLGGW